MDKNYGEALTPMTWTEDQKAQEFLFLAGDLWYKVEEEGFVKRLRIKSLFWTKALFTQLQRMGGWPQLG